MQALLERLAPILRVTRVAMAFAAVANAWFVVLWTRAFEQEPGHAALSEAPLWLCLVGVTANALGLFSFGMALNDILDLRRDRLLNPGRPLPTGSLTVGATITLVSWSLMVAVLGATVCGTPSVLLTLLLAGMILVFNGAARFVPGFGLVAYGVIYAGAMLIPDPRLAFLWPVWLVLAHTIVTGSLVYALARKTPSVSRRAWGAVAVGGVFWTITLGALIWKRSGSLWPGWAPPTAAIGPLVVLTLMALTMWRKARFAGPSPRVAEKFERYSTLAMSFLGGAWMLGVGLTAQAITLLSLSVAGYLGMTILREFYGLLEHPVGYRRS